MTRQSTGKLHLRIGRANKIEHPQPRQFIQAQALLLALIVELGGFYIFGIKCLDPLRQLFDLLQFGIAVACIHAIVVHRCKATMLFPISEKALPLPLPQTAIGCWPQPWAKLPTARMFLRFEQWRA